MPLNKETVIKYAKIYDQKAKSSDKDVEKELKALLKNQRFLRKKDFVKIGRWKSTRPQKQYLANDERAVKEISRFSFTAKTEQAQIGVLFALKGVKYPVASAILHFAFPDRYPILDVRALWSLGWKQSYSYNFEFWISYVKKVRKISKKLGLSMRKVDKALWQFSKDNQGSIM